MKVIPKAVVKAIVDLVFLKLKLRLNFSCCMSGLQQYLISELSNFNPNIYHQKCLMLNSKFQFYKQNPK